MANTRTENWKCSSHHPLPSPILSSWLSVAEQKSSRSFSPPLVSRVQLREHSELGKLSSQSPKSHGTDCNQIGIRKFIQEFIQVAFQHQMRSDCLDNLGRWLRTQSQPAQLPGPRLPALVTRSWGHGVTWQGKARLSEQRPEQFAGICPDDVSSTSEDEAKAFLTLRVAPFLIS